MIKPEALTRNKRLDAKMVWKNEEYINDPKSAPEYTWKVYNVTETSIDLNITFARPLLISQGS